MSAFKTTTYLRDIIEESLKEPVIIFKYSKECGSSDRLSRELENEIENGNIVYPVYKVIVQTHRNLSNKIADWFDIKHESPQIIIIKKEKVLYSEHHGRIKISEFKYK